MATKTFDEVQVGDKVRYYDPPLKGDKELETKDYKGGEYDAEVTGILNEAEGLVNLVYEDKEWLPETPERMFRPIMENVAMEVEGRGVIMVPTLKDNEEVELSMPKPGRNIQATGVPFRGRVGSKTRSWDYA